MHQNNGTGFDPRQYTVDDLPGVFDCEAELAVRLLHEGVANMQKAVDADQLNKAKEYMLKQFDVDAKKNGFWINVITSYKDYGIDFYTDYKKTVEALTVDNVRDFLNKFMKSGNHVEVVMTPEAK